jgi:hypothetical protein
MRARAEVYGRMHLNGKLRSLWCQQTGHELSLSHDDGNGQECTSAATELAKLLFLQRLRVTLRTPQCARAPNG